jgi:hypothetical protein
MHMLPKDTMMAYIQKVIKKLVVPCFEPESMDTASSVV